MMAILLWSMPYSNINGHSKIFTEYMERVFHPNMVAYGCRLCLSKWWKGCVMQILFRLNNCQCTLITKLLLNHFR